MPHKRLKYPGRLGKPMKAGEWATFVGATKQRGLAAILRAHESVERELLLALMEHFDIALDDPSRWFWLARSLAYAHVPVFQLARAGRPRKLKTPLAKASSRKGPGRPVVYPSDLEERLLRSVSKIADERGFRGHGAIRRSLDVYVKRNAKRLGLSETQARNYVPWFQRRYSIAATKFPKLALKSRR